jgi:hypothetical protein
MALADEIRRLRDRALAELHAAHDYYADTRVAWDIADQFILAGNTFRVQNTLTGSVTTHLDLPAKARLYVAGRLTAATFQDFVSIFEAFFFDLLRLWLLAYPQSLFGKKVDFRSVFEAPDKDAITLHVVNRELNELLYERPATWFAYLEDRVKLGSPTAEEVERIAEAKASRDVLVHGRGVVGKAYELKAGRFARYREGETMDLPELYHRETWELLCKVVADVSNGAAARA